METVTVVFAKSWKPFSWLVRAFTNSRWSHVGVMTADNKVIEATYKGGVCETPLEDFKKRYTELRYCTVPVKSRKRFFRSLRNQLGKPYDLSGVISLGIGRDWQQSEAWFCSELVAMATEMFRKDSVRRITPEDLWRISEDL